MRQLKLTLEAYLKLPNPVISEHDGEKLNDGTNGGTSRNISWNTPTAIRKWKHFKRDIFDLFNDEPLRNILQTEYTLNNFSDLPPFPFRDVRDEDTLEALLIKSNQSIVCEALDVAHSATQAKTDLKSSLPEMQVLKSHGSIYMARGGQSVFSRFELGEDAKLKKSKHKYYYRPDWAGVRRSDSQEKPRNLYVHSAIIYPSLETHLNFQSFLRNDREAVGPPKVVIGPGVSPKQAMLTSKSIGSQGTQS